MHTIDWRLDKRRGSCYNVQKAKGLFAMNKALRLFDASRRSGSYVRRALKGDTLYSSYQHRDVYMYFGALGSGTTRVEDALTAQMVQAGVISDKQKMACDAHICSAFAAREQIERFDDCSVEDIYRLIHGLRREALGELTLAKWQEINAQQALEIDDWVIDQRPQKGALLLRADSVIFALFDERFLSQLRADLQETQRQNKKAYVLYGGDCVPEKLLKTWLEDAAVQWISLDAPCEELQADVDGNRAALFAYGEEALLWCRSLRINAAVHAQPAGCYARALINTLDAVRGCVVYVPAHLDITEYVPLRERSRLTYWHLYQLYKDFGEEVYACPVETMYRRWPQYFLNMYQNGACCTEAQADYPLKVVLPEEGDALAQLDVAREKAAADFLNSFSNLTFSAHCFDENLAACPLPYGLETPHAGILVHAARVKAARSAGVLSRAEDVPLRRMFSEEQTGIFSNFLFFMTPKLAALYNDLRCDRLPEQADVTAGHLDYKLCYENGKRVETFPLFEKMCMAMKADGTFLFFNFRLGGGRVRVGAYEYAWEKEQVNSATDAPVCVYTPYLSCADKEADRRTYRRLVGEGRVNLIVLQDRVHCIRRGDVVLPSAGVVISLRLDVAQPLLAGLPVLMDGYYSAENLSFSVELGAPECIDAAVWRTVRWAYGGGLSLIRTGNALCDGDDLEAWFDREGWMSPLSRQTQESDLHTLSRHPRTAIGQTKNGDMVLLVFSGRTRLSRGADYVEMCRIARQIFPDVENLMNVDGGASAVLCMVRNGVVTELNCPSTAGTTCAGMARPIKTLLYIPAE